MPSTSITTSHPLLANPVWSALTTRQAAICIDNGKLKHFPWKIAPFCAVQDARTKLSTETLACLPDEVFFVGPVPGEMPGRVLIERRPVLQMVHTGALNQSPASPGSETDAQIRVLDSGDVAQMIALINLTHPGYFRADTASVGNYVGIHHDGELVAMAGQRMHITGYREISGVCTRVGHTGRGHAGRLVERLVHTTIHGGERPFLHVDASNERARALYQRMGFDVVREMRHAQSTGHAAKPR